MAFEQVNHKCQWVGLDQATKFLDLFDFFCPEVITRDPLGFLECELQFHALTGRFFEVDGDFFIGKIPFDHLPGTE